MISIVQTGDTQSGTPANVVYGSAQSANNANLVLVAWGDNSGFTNLASTNPVTDTKNGAYTQFGSVIQYNAGGSNISAAVFYYPSIAAAAANANTVQVSWVTGPSFVDVYIVEASGCQSSNPMDTTMGIVSGNGNNGGPTSAGPAATNFANEMLIGWMFTYSGGVAATSGWTMDSNSPTGDGSIMEYQLVASAGTSKTAGCTLGGAATWLQIMVGLIPPQSSAPAFGGCAYEC